MISLSATSHRGPRAIRLATFLLALAGCRPTVAPEPTQEPEGPVAPLPTFPALEEEEFTALDLSPDPLPPGVAAAVDGEPILEDELERLAATGPAGEDPEAARALALVQLVERRLILSKADQMDIRATEDEVQRAIDGVARQGGLSPEQLEQEVAAAGWTWEDYRADVIAQIVELKVLSVNGVYGPSPQDPELADALRSRFVGCMRARAEIQLGEGAPPLPDNPYSRIAKVAEFRLRGDIGLPEDQLRAAAMEAAKARVRLCDALTSAELAMEELYVEGGYLGADVRIPWPAEIAEPVTIDVEVVPGLPHVIGTVSFDQSAAPRAKRLDPKQLQERVASILVKGETATMSALQAAGAEVSEAFGKAGLGPVEPLTELKTKKGRVRVNITFVLVGSET